jgi:hypothetical protein
MWEYLAYPFLFFNPFIFMAYDAPGSSNIYVHAFVGLSLLGPPVTALSTVITKSMKPFWIYYILWHIYSLWFNRGPKKKHLI